MVAWENRYVDVEYIWSTGKGKAGRGDKKTAPKESAQFC